MFFKCSLLLCLGALAWGGTYYVATNGNNSTGNGSSAKPWQTITYAVAQIPDDGSTIMVKDGTYNGRVNLARRFKKMISIRPEHVYKAILVNSESTPVITSFGGANFEIKGFEIKRPSASATGALVFQIQQGGGFYAEDIEIRDNIIHDSYNNDLLKINNGARRILVIGNIFYNQKGYDEHIDINGVTDVTVRKNIFFNDFAGSGRSNGNNTGSFIVVKNSAGLPENKRINIQQNVFLNYQGAPSASFVTVGDDGKSYFEAEDVLIENNLMIGNSPNIMRAPFTVQGSRRVTIRNNTITGNLPARAYGISIGRPLSNPPVTDLVLHNNIWSDPTGTMEDFSDGVKSMGVRVTMTNNLYWNGGKALPTDTDILNVVNDTAAVVSDPRLPGQGSIVLPRMSGGRFRSGNTRILEEFERLARTYGVPAASSPVIKRSLVDESPKVDILGRPRGGVVDMGCFNFSSGTTSMSEQLQALSGVEAENSALAPGKLVRLTGARLSEVVEQAEVGEDGAWPTHLGDLALAVDGRIAELLSVSPEQIVFRMPEDAPLRGEILLSRDGVESQSIPYSAKPVAPGIFTRDEKAVIADAASGKVIPQDQPLLAGRTITVYAIGLNQEVETVRVWFGGTVVEGKVAEEATFPGLYQVQVTVPAGVDGATEISLEYASVRSTAYKLTVAH